ncbi:MAG: NADH-quinone oxidoreductase subunit A, partial [Gammaproteobacteria bacterium]
MLRNYVPILIFLIIAGGLGVVLLGLGFALGRGEKTSAKLSPYECGFEAFEDSRMRF